MAKFAIIETGGKQYKVSSGQKIRIEKISAPAGDRFDFDKVLLVADGDNVKVGMPYLPEKLAAEVLNHSRADKKLVFRYHSKTRYHKKKGHRQEYTEVKII